MKNISLLIGAVLLMASAALTENGETKPADSAQAALDSLSQVTEQSDQVVVYYLHMDRRCMTCEKLEAYSEEAISSGFAEQLRDSSIVWSVLNFEAEGNEHFAKDYKLYTQSVILSREIDGEESEWKNLDQIWILVGDKEKFIAYVQAEVKQFLDQTEKK